MKTMAKMMIVICFLSIMMGGLGVQAKTVKDRPKVGLVLGGGGAKGAATVGVLKYIETAGIPIDYIAGTSIGSIVGGLYACGYRSTQLDSLFRTQEWTALLTDRNMDFSGKPVVKRNGVTYLFGFPVARKGSAMVDKSVGMIRGDRILALLDSMTNVRDSLSFDSLPIPFRCVATDYVHRRKVVMKEGNLAKSMRASMAIPGAFKAVDIDGVELLDGGLIDNLPVDVVLDMGADIVIAIDLAVNKHEDSEAWKRERSSKKYENAKSYLGQLLHWVKQRPDLTQYQENLKHIDVYINPDLKGFSAASFNEKKVAEMIRKGEEAGEKAMPELERVKEMTGEKKK